MSVGKHHVFNPTGARSFPPFRKELGLQRLLLDHELYARTYRRRVAPVLKKRYWGLEALRQEMAFRRRLTAEQHKLTAPIHTRCSSRKHILSTTFLTHANHANDQTRRQLPHFDRASTKTVHSSDDVVSCLLCIHACQLKHQGQVEHAGLGKLPGDLELLGVLD